MWPDPAHRHDDAYSAEDNKFNNTFNKCVKMLLIGIMYFFPQCNLQSPLLVDQFLFSLEQKETVPLSSWPSLKSQFRRL